MLKRCSKPGAALQPPTPFRHHSRRPVAVHSAGRLTCRSGSYLKSAHAAVVPVVPRSTTRALLRSTLICKHGTLMWKWVVRAAAHCQQQRASTNAGSPWRLIGLPLPATAGGRAAAYRQVPDDDVLVTGPDAGKKTFTGGFKRHTEAVILLHGQALVILRDLPRR